MAEEDIRIELVKVKDLQVFASGIIKEAKPGQFIPITLHRALALSKNPFASPDDVSMLVAFRYHGRDGAARRGIS